MLSSIGHICNNLVNVKAWFVKWHVRNEDLDYVSGVGSPCTPETGWKLVTMSTNFRELITSLFGHNNCLFNRVRTGCFAVLECPGRPVVHTCQSGVIKSYVASHVGILVSKEMVIASV